MRSFCALKCSTNLFLGCLQEIFDEGPWFLGRIRSFITLSFPNFDPTTMVVPKMSIWVRFPNFPLPFCHHSMLQDIGNTLGKYLKDGNERT